MPPDSAETSDSAARPAVLVVAPCAFPLDRGTPIRIQRLAALMSERYEVHVAAFHQGKPGDHPFRIHRILPLPFDVTRSSGASVKKLICDFFLFFVVMWVVLRHRIRIVDGHLHEGALLGLFARLLFRVRVVYNSHGTLAAEMIASGIVREGSLPARGLQRMEDGIERSVDLIVAQSAMRADEFVAKGRPRHAVAVVEDAPLFEDYSVPEPDPELVRRYREGTEAVVIYTGELMTYQGIDLILDAWPSVLERHPTARLILFGRPIDAYEARVRDEGLAESVALVDDEPFERLRHYFAISDVALVPRLYGRNVPGKLPIYMMGRQTIVGTDLEGINTVLRHGETGWLVPPEPDALANALCHLIEDPELRERLAEAALAEAERRYAPELVEAALTDAYESLLEGSPVG